MQEDRHEQLLHQILNAIGELRADFQKHKAVSVEEESYTTEEAAQRLGRSEWTVRQWCNRGQVNGAKKVHGRGRRGEWRISHEALLRLQNEGPTPVSRKAS